MISELLEELSVAGEQLLMLALGGVKAAIVILITIPLHSFLRTRVERRLDARHVHMNIRGLLLNIFTVSVVLVSVTVIFAFWGLTWTAFVAAVSVGTLVVAMGFQTVLQSIVAGYAILTERPFSVGDRIRIRGDEGVVESIGIRTTHVLLDNGDRLSMPNSLVFTEPLLRRARDSAAVNWDPAAHEPPPDAPEP